MGVPGGDVSGLVPPVVVGVSGGGTTVGGPGHSVTVETQFVFGTVTKTVLVIGTQGPEPLPGPVDHGGGAPPPGGIVPGVPG